MLLDTLIRRVGVIQDLVDRVLPVQDTEVMSEEGVERLMSVTRQTHESGR